MILFEVFFSNLIVITIFCISLICYYCYLFIEEKLPSHSPSPSRIAHRYFSSNIYFHKKNDIVVYFIKEPGHCISNITSSIFPYNWQTVIFFLNKIDYIINYKDSMCDLYSMEYISESTNNYSQGVLQCVQDCTNIPGHLSARV